MSELKDNTKVIYCPSRNPYDEEPLRGVDAYNSLEQAFPDICLKSHWDPTLLANRFILPSTEGPLPTDYRPFTRICTNYFTGDRGSGLGPYTGAEGLAPKPIRMGGRASTDMPYGDFARSVDRESDLHNLSRRLTKGCTEYQYMPESPQSLSQQMEQVFPEQMVMTVQQQRILNEVNRPKATIRGEPFDCRALEDCRNSAVSQRQFNNPTKYDRQQKAVKAATENGQQRTDGYSSRV